MQLDKIKCTPLSTRWFKYDRDWFVCKQAGYSPGPIWTTLYILTFGAPNFTEIRVIWSMTPAGSNIGGLYQKLYIQSSAPEDGRKYRPKHVELIGYKQINQNIASYCSSITNYVYFFFFNRSQYTPSTISSMPVEAFFFGKFRRNQTTQQNLQYLRETLKRLPAFRGTQGFATVYTTAVCVSRRSQIRFEQCQIL